MQNKADYSIRNTDGKTALDLSDPSAHQVLTGEYRQEELLEAARTGNTGVLMSLLTPLNVNCHAGDGRKVRDGFLCRWLVNCCNLFRVIVHSLALGCRLQSGGRGAAAPPVWCGCAR